MEDVYPAKMIKSYDTSWKIEFPINNIVIDIFELTSTSPVKKQIDKTDFEGIQLGYIHTVMINWWILTVGKAVSGYFLPKG